MVSSQSGMEVVPIDGAPLGAEVRGLPEGARLDELSEQAFSELSAALARHSLLVFRGQERLPPSAAAAFVRRFDPDAKTVWRDQGTNPWELYKAQRLGGAGTFQLPECPECLCLGNGPVEGHYGLTATLGGKRPAYGSSGGSQVIGGGQLQWHIDGAFWATRAATGLPCRVTAMRCFASPGEDGSRHEIPLGDGTALLAARGATAFVSAYEAFDRLTPHEQEQALRTTVRYSVHPFKRFAGLGMTVDGLRCVGGKAEETPLEKEDLNQGGAAMRLPLVWTHPETGRRALMPHTRCMEALEIAGSQEEVCFKRHRVELDLQTTRERVYALTRRAVDAGSVYCHAWRRGDLVLWDNWSLWHSATGGVRPDDLRIMHLIAFDGSSAPACRLPSACPSSPRVRLPSSGEVELPVLALVIGQTPRPDLLEPLRKHLTARLPPRVRLDISCRGGLDGADAAALRAAMAPGAAGGSSSSSCPLVTRLTDGQSVTVSEAALAPRLRLHLRQAAAERVAAGRMPFAATLLLCAGEFAGLCGGVDDTDSGCSALPPLILPSLAATATLRASAPRPSRLTLLVPNDEQGPFAIARWQRAGLDGAIYRVLPEDATRGELSNLVAESCRGDGCAEGHTSVCVLDYVGHPPEVVEEARQAALSAGGLLLDAGQAAFEALAALLLARVEHD